MVDSTKQALVSERMMAYYRLKADFIADIEALVGEIFSYWPEGEPKLSSVTSRALGFKEPVRAIRLPDTLRKGVRDRPGYLSAFAVSNDTLLVDYCMNHQFTHLNIEELYQLSGVLEHCLAEVKKHHEAGTLTSEQAYGPPWVVVE